MKDKKAILMKNVLGILVAIAVIVLLLYLSVSLIGIFTKKAKLEQARESLKLLGSEIDKIEQGEIMESEDLFLESPNDWWIIAWPYRDETDKPIHCGGDYCICLCPIAYTKENSLKECNNLGVCKDVSIPVKTMYESKPDSTLSKFIKNVVSIFGDTKNVPLDIEGPLPLKIIKENNEIIIIK